MNPRRTWLWLLSAAILFLLILAHDRYLRRPPSGPVKILPDIKPGAVTSLEILRPSSEVEIRVERTNSGWVLTKPLGYPAQSGSIEALLAVLERLVPMTSITASELKDRPGADEEFGLANPQASVLIEHGEQRTRLLLGSTTGPGDQLYVQIVGGEEVYVVDSELLKLIPRASNDWRDRTLLDLKTISFDRLAVTNARKTFMELQFDPAHALWHILKPPLRADGAKVQQALERLQSLRVTQFISDDPKAELEPLGLQSADLELAFCQGTNTLALLQFGKTNESGGVFARRLGQNTIVTVDNALLAPWHVPVKDFRDQHLVTLVRPVQMIEIISEESSSVQRQTNDTWRVMPDNTPADTTQVNDFVTVLTSLVIQDADVIKDVVTDSGLAEYGLASPIRKYILHGAAEAVRGTNTVLAELHFGALQGDRVLVRRTDESSVYAIHTNDFARLPSSGWQLRDRRLWSFNDDDILKATILNKGRACEILRKERYKWTIAPGSQGLIKDEMPLEETIRGLATLTATSWVARGDKNASRYGLSDSSLKVTLESKKGDKATIQFGAEASPAAVYASTTLDGQLWIFECSWLLFRDVTNHLPIPQ